LAGLPLTRLQRTTSLAGRTVRPSLFVHNNGAVLPGPDFRGTKKEKAAESHLELLDNLPGTTLIAYSDGSQDEIGNTGWGAISFHKARATKSNGCLPNAEVYDAEAVGAFEAMKLARERARQDPSINEVILFLDNSAVVDGILGQTPRSSQSAYMGLRKIARELLPGTHTKVAWVPGHQDILGNEAADKLAKEGAILHRLYAERTGHGDFVEYHERFGHDATPACKCGEPRTQGHFVECRMVQPFLPEVPERDHLEGVTPLDYLLGPNGHKHFQALVEDTDPYGPAP
ncbi:ribonuclease H-like domain-containing protein, partial [Trichoderma austrokoningii]